MINIVRGVFHIWTILYVVDILTKPKLLKTRKIQKEGNSDKKKIQKVILTINFSILKKTAQGQ